ncbi:insulinase family protein [Lentilactobacillus senioris]|uniref:EF-P 5-aminopentanol modification-associated protein YfmF n=1 Tax=Lentilactobacillus senioris TaxID=931534 RepID=UPI002280E5DF|nr:insulinase family protein [Lentilactobacillus senioris]MCY9807307.1 insulinase family protein [Lentilactobacillus senioris]
MQNNLHFQLKAQESTKFKNNILYINFIEPLKADNLAKRALLAEMLGNFSQLLPSEQAVAQKLSYLYGASFGVSVLRLGSQNVLQFKISFANSKFLPNQADLLPEIIAFLDQMISEPLVNNGRFNDDVFKRRQDNLAHYVETIDEDHAFQSALLVRKLFYGTKDDNGEYILGTPAQIRAVDSRSLYSYYQEVFQNDQVIAIAAGDLPEVKLQSLLGQTKLNQTLSDNLTTGVPNLRVNFIPHEVNQSVTKYQGDQTTLSMAGYLPVYWGDPKYFAALLGNYILGGSMQSLLFMNVREKASLAYDVHSNYDSLAGRITIQTGIAATDKDQAQALIKLQVKHLQNGEFTEQMLIAAKTSLLNQHLSGSDSLRTVANRSFLNYFDADLSEDLWQRGLKSVTINDIQNVFKQLKLQAVHIGLAE